MAATAILRPNAQGFYSNWGNVGCSSGSSEWDCVEENPANTADYVSTSSANISETFNFTNMNLTENVTINNVTLFYYAQRWSSTRYRFYPLIRSGGINYLGSLISTTASWVSYTRVYTKNPATNTWWTVSDLDNIEAGMSSHATASYGGRVAQMYINVTYNVSLPDLNMTNLSFLEYNVTNVTNGTTVTKTWVNITSTITNDGPGTAAASTVRLTGLVTQTTATPALAVGGTSTKVWVYECTASHTATVTADYLDVVQETTEADNAGSTAVDCII